MAPETLKLRKQIEFIKIQKLQIFTFEAGFEQIFFVELPAIHRFHGPTNTCNIEQTLQ